ncbi:hypothetical protein F7725_024697 [Dissostichus mawsoni]|uniref:Uncharacterized protein n=1 Tax=Dissostichus mawsoni TaxID=36200 RepID=A0A7J5X9J9_DISMA|nr:hypothetical protein F7725_024697 [Dissostichus mawsoni]
MEKHRRHEQGGVYETPSGHVQYQEVFSIKTMVFKTFDLTSLIIPITADILWTIFNVDFVELLVTQRDLSLLLPVLRILCCDFLHPVLFGFCSLGVAVVMHHLNFINQPNTNKLWEVWDSRGRSVEILDRVHPQGPILTAILAVLGNTGNNGPVGPPGMKGESSPGPQVRGNTHYTLIILIFKAEV